MNIQKLDIHLTQTQRMNIPGIPYKRTRLESLNEANKFKKLENKKKEKQTFAKLKSKRKKK